MLALKILDVKNFMNQLLIGETFDNFQTVEVSITTFNTFSIDGSIKRDFLDTDAWDLLEQKELFYSFWKDLKAYCYSIIRGKRTPLSFKIIFQISGSQKLSILKEMNGALKPENVKGLFLNLQYKNKELLCTTGVSLNTFFPDKSPEQLWDQAVLDFFRKHAIAFEKL